MLIKLNATDYVDASEVVEVTLNSLSTAIVVHTKNGMRVVSPGPNDDIYNMLDDLITRINSTTNNYVRCTVRPHRL